MKTARQVDKQPSTLHDKADIDFEVLYNRYVGKVYLQCLSITKDSDIAQDYTQDIFIKVFNKIDTFESRSTFSTWLYSISQHYCLDQLRLKKRLMVEPLSDSAIGGTPEADGPTMEAQLQDLEIVLNQLPPDEVALLRLKHEQGLSIKEISEQYQLSESAVKMRLKRTRDKLHRLYNNYAF